MSGRSKPREKKTFIKKGRKWKCKIFKTDKWRFIHSDKKAKQSDNLTNGLPNKPTKKKKDKKGKKKVRIMNKNYEERDI